jgi:hypothetical protein
MANLTVNRDSKQRIPTDEYTDPVKGATHLHAGAAVLKDADGYLIKAASGAVGKSRGVMLREVDNTDGADGALSGRVRSGVFEFHIDQSDPVDDGDCESVVYFLDDHTISKTSNSGARPPAGRLKKVEGTSTAARALVAVGPEYSVDGDLLAANNLSDVASAATARGNLGIKGFVGGVFPLNAAGVFYIPLPIACTIMDIRTAVEAATTAAGAATLTCALDTVDITNGVVTIASGAVVGEKDSATPSAANVATEGQNLRVTVAPNSQSAAAFARMTVEFTY